MQGGAAGAESSGKPLCMRIGTEGRVLVQLPSSVLTVIPLRVFSRQGVSGSIGVKAGSGIGSWIPE